MKVYLGKKNENLDLNKKVYQCFICDRLFNWGNNTYWYGSYKDSEDNPDKIKHFCSNECMDKFRITNK